MKNVINTNVFLFIERLLNTQQLSSSYSSRLTKHVIKNLLNRIINAQHLCIFLCV